MTVEPISLAEAKAHLRVDDDDPYVSNLPGIITAARQTVEQYLNSSVANQERVLRLDTFTDVVRLPNGPILSVTSIKYIDTDGTEQTISVNDYVLVYNMIAPAFGLSWPTPRDQPGAITITYQAGMMAGSPLTLDREDIKSAIKLVLGDLWNVTEGSIIGAPISVNPTVERLLNPYRLDMGV